MAKCTFIKLKTVDQRLTAVQQPVLASGDVGSVRVEYALDSYWDGYTASGTFYTGKKPEDVYEQQLTEGACVIPWEVLQEDGVLYIGLRGVDAAGLIKTAAPVRYRIEKGSPIGSATAKGPTPDVYQQMLESMKETEEIAQSVRDDADNGVFIGKQGPVGPAGVYVGTEAPTNGETVWIDTDAESDAQVDVVAKVGQVLVVKAVDEEGHPTELQAVDFPKAPAANWNANEGEEGHIEGRTHYVDKHGVVHKLDNKFINAEWMATKEEYGGGVELSKDFAFTSAWFFLSPHWFPDVGADWDVYWNGTKYTCSLVTAAGESFLGNMSLINSSNPDTGEPFVFSGYALEGKDPEIISLKKNTSTKETVSVVITTHHEVKVNKLPVEYLPDEAALKSDIPEGGGGANIDVTASVGQTIVVEEVDADGKPTKWKAAEYQERTHYYTMDYLIPETTIEGSGLETVVDSCLVEGETYVVNWEGVDYTCVCRSVTADGITIQVIGNEVILGGSDTGEPFGIGTALVEGNKVAMIQAIDDSVTSCTFSIKSRVCVPIPAQYLTNVLPYYVEVYRECSGGIAFTDCSCSETRENLETIYNSGRLIVLRLKIFDTLNETTNWDYYQLSGAALPKDSPILLFSFVNSVANSGNGQSALIFVPNEGGTYDISEEFGSTTIT